MPTQAALLEHGSSFERGVDSINAHIQEPRSRDSFIGRNRLTKWLTAFDDPHRHSVLRPGMDCDPSRNVIPVPGSRQLQGALCIILLTFTPPLTLTVSLLSGKITNFLKSWEIPEFVPKFRPAQHDSIL